MRDRLAVEKAPSHGLAGRSFLAPWLSKAHVRLVATRSKRSLTNRRACQCCHLRSERAQVRGTICSKSMLSVSLGQTEICVASTTLVLTESVSLRHPGLPALVVPSSRSSAAVSISADACTTPRTAEDQAVADTSLGSFKCTHLQGHTGCGQCALQQQPKKRQR